MCYPKFAEYEPIVAINDSQITIESDEVSNDGLSDTSDENEILDQIHQMLNLFYETKISILDLIECNFTFISFLNNNSLSKVMVKTINEHKDINEIMGLRNQLMDIRNEMIKNEEEVKLKINDYFQICKQELEIICSRIADIEQKMSNGFEENLIHSLVHSYSQEINSFQYYHIFEKVKSINVHFEESRVSLMNKFIGLLKSVKITPIMSVAING